MEPAVSEPFELDLCQRAWVYRIWDKDDMCLYVGQTFALHPARRVREHMRTLWWEMVTRVDYFEVYDPHKLSVFERAEIRRLHPIFNVMGKTWLAMMFSSAAEPLPGGCQVRSR